MASGQTSLVKKLFEKFIRLSKVQFDYFDFAVKIEIFYVWVCVPKSKVKITGIFKQIGKTS